MRVWRICKGAHASFDGEGARRYGGRWNPPGIAVVYCSQSLALAALELLVHLDPDVLPGGLVAQAAEIPEGLTVQRVLRPDLPKRWRCYPASAQTRAIGCRWVSEGRNAVLAVPSAVIPRESNYLLNPRHPEFARIRIGRPFRFDLDPRLMG